MVAFGDVELFNVELLHSSFLILHRLADHSTLHIPHSTFYIGSADHSTFHTPHSTFFIDSADHSTFHTPHSTFLSYCSLQRYTKQLLCLHSKLHRQLVEHILGIAVYDESYSLLCWDATLVAVEELVF